MGLDAWLAKSSSDRATADMNPDDPAVLLYTSSTTGFPKGATLSHGNVVTNCWATVHHAGYKKEDPMILFLPVFHVFGQNFIMNATFMACATLVLHRRFVPDRVLDSIRRDRVTMFFAVPTIYIALLNAPLPDEAFASIRIKVFDTFGYEHPFARGDYEKVPRRQLPLLPVQRRTQAAEVEEVLDEAEARIEGRRCLHCWVNTVFDSEEMNGSECLQ